MKKEWFLALVCLLGGVGADVASRSVEASDVEAVASTRVESLLVEAKKLSDAAKKNYSPRYDRTVADARRTAREKIVALEEYAAKNPGDRQTRSFLDELRRRGLTGDEVSAQAFRTGAEWAARYVATCSLPKEKAPNEVVVALQRYVEASARTSETLSKEEAELFEEERVYFGEICDYFVDCLRTYLRENDLESLDAVTFALAELNYCQPESPSVEEIVAKTRSCFKKPNFYLEIDEPTLSSFAGRPIDERFVVCENIRGAQASGVGRLTGDMTVKLRENADKAELCLALSASVATRTVGSSRGVRVDSDNFGRVCAEKTVFWGERGLETSPSVARGTMKTRVNGVDSDRLMPLGGLVVQNKVAKEIPKTEQESAARMSARVAAQLDEEANRQIVEFNKRWSRTRNVASPEKRAVRGVESRTEKERLYFSCLVGRANQLASPDDALAAWLRVVDRRKRDAEATADSGTARPNDAELPREATVAKRYSSSVERDRVLENVRGAVSLRAHQSAPNNVAFVALAGLAFNGGDMGDALLARFPGVDPADANEFLKRYQANKKVEGETRDAPDEKLVYQFAQDRPFSVRFADDKVVTRLRFDSFERDGRVWRGLEIRFAYRIERENGRFSFRRESIDAIPLGLDETAPIPARFQAFRSVVLNLLDDVVLDEYVVDELPIVDWGTNETLGYLKPISMRAQDGWFETEFSFREAK
ncbi:MAG: hypothetical protein IJO06_03710 [Thermoguttaceae bacterium]|nr:hypothetical protein [Thermoguttaceae bacterium]